APPVVQPNSRTFESADKLAGDGAIVCSVLPGIVLATAVLPCTALTGNCRPPRQPGSLNPITVPTVYTTAPAYLPDAPFVNRLYGESRLNNCVFYDYSLLT